MDDDDIVLDLDLADGDATEDGENDDSGTPPGGDAEPDDTASVDALADAAAPGAADETTEAAAPVPPYGDDRVQVVLDLAFREGRPGDVVWVTRERLKRMGVYARVLYDPKAGGPADADPDD